MRFHRFDSRLLLTAVAGLLLISADICVSPAEEGSSAASDEAKKQRSESLLKMRDRARATKVFLLAGKKATPVKMLEKPIMRYTDPPRGTLDATLWCLTNDGRPAALLKVESRKARWIAGATSLSDRLIEVRWDGTQLFRSTKPEISFERISRAPQAAEKSAGRLRQMKQLARSFSATFTNPNGSEQMRLLPRPVHRYSHPKSDVTDAAMFALASTGTNPNAFLVIELRKGDSKSQWRFGVARMTVGALKVRLDDKTVWEAPYITKRRPAESDTYGSAVIAKEEAAKE